MGPQEVVERGGEGERGGGERGEGRKTFRMGPQEVSERGR